jgi:hypothetical protein
MTIKFIPSTSRLTNIMLTAVVIATLAVCLQAGAGEYRGNPEKADASSPGLQQNILMGVVRPRFDCEQYIDADGDLISNGSIVTSGGKGPAKGPPRSSFGEDSNYECEHPPN